MSAFNGQCIKDELTTASGTAAEKAIDMPKAKGSLLPAIVGIDVLHPALQSVVNKVSRWYLNTKSNGSTEPDANDEEVIISGYRRGGLKTAENNYVEDLYEHIVFPAPVPVTKTTLYFQGYQDSGSGHTYRIRLWWVPRLVKGAIQQQSMDVNVQY